jgi:hypothetical protein
VISPEAPGRLAKSFLDVLISFVIIINKSLAAGNWQPIAF